MFKKVNLEQFAKLDKFDSKIFPDGFANSLASVPNRFALWLQNELQTRYGSQGRRKQYIISALITAMTDNAKERLAKKLGLSRNALAIATTMTAMGVPIETSILMMKNPTISLAYKLESRAPEFTFGLCLSSS